MKSIKKYTLSLALLLASNLCQATTDGRVYEMRTYYAEPGKLEALVARFRDHTTAFFKQFGMTNVGYWIPTNNPDNKLIYILSYPSQEAREAAWKTFADDPERIRVFEASEKNGKLVAKIEQTFMQTTDFSYRIKKKNVGKQPRVFEMRTYKTLPNKLPDLLSRFRNHTTKLLKKHGMTNIAYWVPTDRDNELVYILAHQDEAAAKASFAAFGKDPDWIAARNASEANGKIVEKITSVFMNATDFSLIR